MLAGLALPLSLRRRACQERIGEGILADAGSRLLYGLGVSLLLVVIGFVGLTLGRHDWVASLRSALPFGIVGVIAVVLIAWVRS